MASSLLCSSTCAISLAIKSACALISWAGAFSLLVVAAAFAAGGDDGLLLSGVSLEAAAFATTFFPRYLAMQTGERCPTFLQWLHMSRSCPPSFLAWSGLPHPKHFPLMKAV